MDNNNEPVVYDEITVKKQKKSYYASFLWKLTLCIVIILTIELILLMPVYIFSGFMSSFSQYKQNDFTEFYQRLVDNGVTNTISSVLDYLFLMISVSVGALVLYFMTRKNAIQPEKGKLSFGSWLVMFICCFGIGGIGQFIGSIVNLVILSPAMLLKLVVSNLLSGGNVVADLIYADDSWTYLIFGILTVGIIIPILEELIFRKILINSTCKYGYGAAIMISAFTFAVYHGNFIQFFYAFGLGVLFAYIYCNTGKLRYTVFLHMGYNLYAAAIMPLARKILPKGFLDDISTALDNLSNSLEANPDGVSDAYSVFSRQISYLFNKPGAKIGVILTVTINLFYFFLIFLGIVFIIVFLKKALSVRKTMMLGKEGTKRCAAFNYGAIIFYVFAVTIFVIYYAMMSLTTIFPSLTG